MDGVEFEDVKEHIGAIVHVDRERICDDDVVVACREAMEKRGVLVFPQVHLSDAEQVAFTDKFGERVKFTGTVPGGEGESDLYKITLDKKVNKEPDYVLGTYFWHMDGVTIDQPLPKATFLSARKVSQTGGQTQVCNLYAAYEMLPEETKAEIGDLELIHRLEASLRLIYQRLSQERLDRYRDMASEMVHPLVWEHASGRKSLILGNHADEVVGMSYADGHALIVRLIEWTAQPDFSYSHTWQEGDFVMWDNCGAMHRVVPYSADSGRMMHRTTIHGDQKPGRKLEAQETVPA